MQDFHEMEWTVIGRVDLTIPNESRSVVMSLREVVAALSNGKHRQHTMLRHEDEPAHTCGASGHQLWKLTCTEAWHGMHGSGAIVTPVCSVSARPGR